MGCVVTPIVGRPRPLSRHRHAQTTGTCLYTLICEEPIISYDVPDMYKIGPRQGNNDAEGFYEDDVYYRVTSDLESLGIGPEHIAI